MLQRRNGYLSDRPLPLAPPSSWASRPLKILAGLAVALALTACASAQVVKREQGLAAGPWPTLLATYQVELARTESGGGLAMTGGQLAKFGEAALPVLIESLGATGFTLELQGDAARPLDTELSLFSFGRPSNKLATLTGVWTHPETSGYRFDAKARASDSVVSKTLQSAESGHDYFASITLHIDEAKGFPVERAPLIKLSVRVLSKAGTPVFFARTEGSGNAVAIAADRSLDNLLRGLQGALTQLHSLQVESF